MVYVYFCYKSLIFIHDLFQIVGEINFISKTCIRDWGHCWSRNVCNEQKIPFLFQAKGATLAWLKDVLWSFVPPPQFKMHPTAPNTFGGTRWIKSYIHGLLYSIETAMNFIGHKFYWLNTRCCVNLPAFNLVSLPFPNWSTQDNFAIAPAIGPNQRAGFSIES